MAVSSSESVSVVYEEFFVFPSQTVSLSTKHCIAKCKLCLKKYKYTLLTTKGNLLKHLQTLHSKALCEHKEERLRLLKSNQSSLITTGSLVKKQSEFKNQDYILTSIV